MRSRSFKPQGLMALENEQAEIDEVRRAESGEARVNPEDEDNANSLETTLMEANDDADVVDEVHDEVEDAVDTVEALEALREDVITANQNGGLNRGEVKYLRMHLESLYDRIGLDVPAATPSLESFDGAAGRARATVALEADIKAKVKEIWEKIKAALKRAWEWVVGVWNKFFDQATKNEDRAKKLLKRAQEISPNGSAAKNFEKDSLVKALFVDGKVPGDASGATRVKEVTEGILKGYGAFADGMEKAVELAVTGSGDAAAVMNAINNPVDTVGGALETVSNPSAEGISAGEGDVVKRSKELPGGKAFVTKSGKDEVTMGIANYSTKSQAPSDKKVPTLDKSGCEAVAKQVAETATFLKGVKGSISKVSGVKKKAYSLVDKAAAKEVQAEKSSADESKAALKAFKALLGTIDRPFLDLTRYALVAGKHHLDQVEQSLQILGGKAAKKDDKAAQPAAA